MDIHLEDYLSAGYLITQFVDGASLNQWMRDVNHATEDLLPSRILSVGFCGASFAPIFKWVSPLVEDYARFGIPENRISELTSWANELFDKEIGHPNLFFRLRTAREYIRRFTNQSSDMQLLGIGLHQERLHQVHELEQGRPGYVSETGAKVTGFAGSGFAQALRLKESPERGEILGFDVVCLEANIDHSWHCNGLAVDAVGKFNFYPNQFGLIDNKSDADKMADYAEEIESEDGTWLPVLVTRYPLTP